jgi:hypothetical protein
LDEKTTKTMNAGIISTLLGSLLSMQFLVADSLNLVHLAESAPSLQFRVECQKLKQEFSLDYLADSGSFILPQAKATIHIAQKDSPSCPIPVAKHGSIAIVVQKKKSLAWHRIESKPSADQNALRILNLCEQPVTVDVEKQGKEIAAGEEFDLGIINKKRISVKIQGAKAQSITPEETAAFLAIVYPTTEGPKIRFIADR